MFTGSPRRCQLVAGYLLASLLALPLPAGAESPPSPGLPATPPAATPAASVPAALPRARGLTGAAASVLPAPSLPLGPMQEVGWGGGESMTFAIKLSGIEGGRGAISVGMPRTQAGRRSLKIRAYSESSPFVSIFRRMREDDLVQIDLAGILPLHWTSDRTQGDRRRQLDTAFGPLLQQEIRQQDRTFQRQRRIKPPVLDALSALFILRSVPLTPGKRFSARVLGGLNLYHVEISVSGPDRLIVRDRPRETLRLDGWARQINDAGQPLPGEPTRKFSLWLSADASRIPYRAEGDTKLGPAEAVLTSRKAPRRALRVRVARLPELLAGVSAP